MTRSPILQDRPLQFRETPLTETEAVAGSAALSMTNLSVIFNEQIQKLVISFEKITLLVHRVLLLFYPADKTVGMATRFSLSNLSNRV